MKQQTILVTGGAGFVGSVCVELLVAQGYEVIVLDNLQTGNRRAVHPKSPPGARQHRQCPLAAAGNVWQAGAATAELADCIGICMNGTLGELGSRSSPPGRSIEVLVTAKVAAI